MAEGYGKIYESTWWGDTTNSIYWGSVYANLAGGVVSDIVNSFAARVVADGGSVESTACLETDLTYLTENPIVPDFTGLLNDYSGAAAAYSLRLLDNTYSGNAVRVRRASDNTEQDIGFANNELDTTSLETFCSGTDGFVTTWYDQSGNAANAANATAAYQPKIVASGSTIFENGKAAIDWDGTTIYLDSSYTGGSMTSYISVLSAEDTNIRAWTFTDNASGLRNKASNTLCIKGTTDVDIISNTATLGQILVDGYGVNPISNYVDGSLESTGNQGQYSNNSLRIGSTDIGTLSWNGTEQELIFYNTDQSANRTGIETNINTHYSIY
jgi:hypothetical protein